MTKVRQVRYAVIALNLTLVVAVAVAAVHLIQGTDHEPLGDYDPTSYALEGHVAPVEDYSVIAEALDRPLPEQPEAVREETPAPQNLPPPPALTLSALLPNEGDDRLSLAIVRRDGQDQVLGVGDQVSTWRVAAIRVKDLGKVSLGILTLEKGERIQTYEAQFTPS